MGFQSLDCDYSWDIYLAELYGCSEIHETMNEILFDTIPHSSCSVTIVEGRNWQMLKLTLNQFYIEKTRIRS